VVDTRAPTVSSIVISSATGIQNNLLNVGDNVSVTATFSEAVIVDNSSGTPTLTLAVGDDNQTATYTSGSGGTTLVFKYTIQVGETDSNGISIRADVLALNSGTIKDATGNNATLTHSALTDNASYKVDTTAPTANFSAATDDVGPVRGALTNGNTTDDTALVLSGTNESGSSVKVYNGSTELGSATVSETSWSYSATVVNGTTYQFNVRETDLAGNTSNATSNFAVTGDTTAPTVSSVAITSATGIQNNLLNAGDVVSVTATFSENVPVTGTPQLTLNVGGTSRTANYTSGSGNTTLVFQYTIQAGETDSDGISIGANVLALNSGTIKDAAGNNATLTHSAVSANTSYKVDTTALTVNSFTISDTLLVVGDNATVDLVFSEPASFSSDDDITVANGTFAAMTSSDNITWAGTFTPNDNIADLTNKLRLKSNSFTDIAGNYGTRPYAKWSFDNTTENFVVDTGGAAVTSFSPSNNKVCIPVSENITVTFNFPMYNSITSDESTGCGASIMVSSSDDSGVFFITPNCVPFPGNPVASDNNTTFTLDPVDNLSYETTYKIKVTTAVESALRNNLSNQYVSSFITSPAPSSVSGLFMAVGSSGKILRSTDNGSSWDIANCQFATNLADVTFGNNTYVAVFDNGTTIRSTDNGSSFSIISFEEDLNGVTFGNNTFVAVGDSGKIVRSTDNGSSWDNATSGISQYLNGITLGNNTFVGVGSGGKIVRSTDNGSSWDNATSGISQQFQGITFGNNTFVAVGQSGKIMRSTDNGSSWDNATSNTSNILYGVTFGNNTFVGVGQSGNIVRSTDNGTNWDNATSPITTNIRGVTFGNNTFVGVGSGGKIVRSTDNGTNWDNATSPITTYLNGVTFSE